MDNKNILFYALAAGGIFLVVYMVMQERNKPKPAPTPTPSPTPLPAITGSTNTAGTALVVLDKNKVLSKDMTGYKPEVKALQTKLNALGSFNLVVDGIFGELTRAALSQATTGTYQEISLNQFDVIFPQTANINGPSTTTVPTTTPTGQGTTPKEAGLSAWWNPFSWFGVYGF